MDWLWAFTAAISVCLSLVLFILYQQARKALINQQHDSPAVPPLEEVAALLQELEDAGELIIGRLEAKQAEAEALLKLLDAKLSALQLALKAQATYHESNSAAIREVAAGGQSTAVPPLADKHNLVRSLFESGLSPLQIAKETGIGLDEVRLVINLLKLG